MRLQISASDQNFGSERRIGFQMFCEGLWIVQRSSAPIFSLRCLALGAEVRSCQGLVVFPQLLVASPASPDSSAFPPKLRKGAAFESWDREDGAARGLRRRRPGGEDSEKERPASFPNVETGCDSASWLLSGGVSGGRRKRRIKILNFSAALFRAQGGVEKPLCSRAARCFGVFSKERCCDVEVLRS